MNNPEKQAETTQQQPLQRDEIMAVIGAVMVVAGVFCPAVTLSNSFFAAGNTVAVVVLGLAGATGWAIALRRPAAVMWNGVLTVVIVATFGIALWYDEVREPVRTFFGTFQAEMRPTAWILIGIGAVLVALAGYRARGCDRQCTQLLTPSQRLTTAGIILATLGCLFAIALTNPLGPMSQGSLRQMGRSWDEQLNVVRWLLMTGAMLAVVLSAQIPRLADRALRVITGVTWLLVGNALFILLSTQVTASLYLTVFWNIGCFGLLLWKTNPRRPWTRLERLILWLPYLTVGVLLLVMGEFGDLIFAGGPPAVVTAAGYMICRRAKWADEATYAAMLFVGIPAVGMALREVPDEYIEPCGLSTSEGRVLLLILVGVLAWSIFLSFCTTPSNGGCSLPANDRLAEPALAFEQHQEESQPVEQCKVVASRSPWQTSPQSHAACLLRKSVMSASLTTSWAAGVSVARSLRPESVQTRVQTESSGVWIFHQGRQHRSGFAALGLLELFVEQLHFSGQGRRKLGEPNGNFHASMDHRQQDNRTWLKIAGEQVFVHAVECERWVKIGERLQQVWLLPDSFQTGFKIVEVLLRRWLPPLLGGVFEYFNQVRERTLGEYQPGL